jgi:hypothetical protein
MLVLRKLILKVWLCFIDASTARLIALSEGSSICDNHTEGRESGKSGRIRIAGGSITWEQFFVV